MLQQSELIFDFASDHVNMSQVSKHCQQKQSNRYLSSCNPIQSNALFLISAGGILRLPRGDCGAGPPPTPALVCRSSVWTDAGRAGPPAAAQRSVHTNTHTSAFTAFICCIYISLLKLTCLQSTSSNVESAACFKPFPWSHLPIPHLYTYWVSSLFYVRLCEW